MTASRMIGSNAASMSSVADALSSVIPAQTSKVLYAGLGKDDLFSVLTDRHFDGETVSETDSCRSYSGATVVIGPDAVSEWSGSRSATASLTKMSDFMGILRAARNASRWIVVATDAAAAGQIRAMSASQGRSATLVSIGSLEDQGGTLVVCDPQHEKLTKANFDFPPKSQTTTKALVWHPKLAAGWTAGDVEPEIVAKAGLNKYVELFAGIGGFGLALNSFDMRCAMACEIDEKAQATYFLNHGVTPHGDVTVIAPKDYPDHDVLVGGAPCQPHSTAGHRLGHADPRGQLLFQFPAIAAVKKPRVVVIENVVGLKTVCEGETFKRLVVAMEDAGYVVFHRIINSSGYGVPQCRKRIFIVAFRRDLGVTEFEFPKPKWIPVSVADILEDDPAVFDRHVIRGRSDFVWTSSAPYGDEVRAVAARLKHKPFGLCKLGHYSFPKIGYRVFSSAGQSPTLTAFGGGIGKGSALFTVGGVHRRPSKRERARIMGYPESLQMPYNDDISFSQLGNSVTPCVVRAIIAQIIRTLAVARQ